METYWIFQDIAHLIIAGIQAGAFLGIFFLLKQSFSNEIEN